MSCCITLDLENDVWQCLVLGSRLLQNLGDNHVSGGFGPCQCVYAQGAVHGDTARQGAGGLQLCELHNVKFGELQVLRQ